jgi:DNA ligase-associated metallophosphoesterase
MRLCWAGAAWQLLPDRALLAEDSATLIVADAHFGKAATFRARGVPVPHGTTARNLGRLTDLVQATRARALVFLGDLFHARESYARETIAAMTAWRSAHAAIDMVLVEGNHDRSAGPMPEALAIRVVQEPWPLGPALLCHHPQQHDDGFVIAGHLHPAVRLSGRGDDNLRLPCFWWRERLAILPAFGEFTGGATIARETGDRVVAVAERRLYEIPAARSDVDGARWGQVLPFAPVPTRQEVTSLTGAKGKT